MKASILKIVFTTILVSLTFSGKLFANNSIAQENTYSKSEKSSISDLYNDDRRKIRLGFTAPSTIHRQLLLTEDENATSGIDWGYDGAYYTTEYDDMYWLIEGQLFTIQGTNSIDEQSNFPIGFHTNDDGYNTIGIDALENISENFNLFLYDTELEVYHNLKEGDYEFYADAGEYLDRFQLVFRSPEESTDSLSIEDNELEDFKIYYNSSSSMLVLNNTTNATLKGLSIYNMAGQLVYNYELNAATSRQEFQFNNQPAKGTYVVLINTEQGTVSDKVILY